MLLISNMAMADDYPCSKKGIEKVVEKKIYLGQTKGAVLANLEGEIMQDHEYRYSPLEYQIHGEKINVWSFTKISAKECRPIKSLFFIKSNFVISLYFDKENKLLASEVTAYHDSL